jgi:hypothetical protein
MRLSASNASFPSIIKQNKEVLNALKRIKTLFNPLRVYKKLIIYKKNSSCR